MRARELGVTGRKVEAVGLGCMGLSWAYHDAAVDASVAEALIRTAIDAGVDHFDTSDAYGYGENEKLVGRAIAASGRRGEIVVATKAGLVGGEGEGSSRYKYARNGRPEYIRDACDASLRRLGLETIDLYYLHRIDPETPVEETWSAMAELVAAGKVRWLGISEAKVAELDRIRRIHPVTAVQSELSLWTRDYHGDVVPWCEANGASFVAFAPLGRGFLTGTITAASRFSEGDFRSTLPRFSAEAVAANQKIVDAVRAVAERLGRTPAQIALAWVLARGEHVLAIPGTQREKYLRQNLAAGDVALSAEDLEELDAVPAPVGGRY
jgi:aryl-alcohol dehydrogenase-like predicted oxidoreductase